MSNPYGHGTDARTNEQKYRDALLYGLCGKCHAPQSRQKILHPDGTVEMALGCPVCGDRDD